jgi:hypothetical protein
MKRFGVGIEACPIVSQLSADGCRASQTPQKIARPARIELAAPRLGDRPTARNPTAFRQIPARIRSVNFSCDRSTVIDFDRRS